MKKINILITIMIVSLLSFSFKGKESVDFCNLQKTEISEKISKIDFSNIEIDKSTCVQVVYFIDEDYKINILEIKSDNALVKKNVISALEGKSVNFYCSNEKHSLNIKLILKPEEIFTVY